MCSSPRGWCLLIFSDGSRLWVIVCLFRSVRYHQCSLLWTWDIWLHWPITVNGIYILVARLVSVSPLLGVVLQDPMSVCKSWSPVLCLASPHRIFPLPIQVSLFVPYLITGLFTIVLYLCVTDICLELNNLTLTYFLGVMNDHHSLQ